MRNIATYLATQLENKEWIKQDQNDFFRFAIEVTLSHFITFSSIVAIGTIINKVFETCIFLLIFCPLRTYSKGYHAKTFLGCYLLTHFSYLFCIYANDIMVNNYIKVVMIGTFCLFVCLEKHLTSNSLKYQIVMGTYILALIIIKLLNYNICLVMFSSMYIVVLANVNKECFNVKKRYIY